MSKLWNKISNLGINDVLGINSLEYKRLKFFNQVLFIGLFAALFQILFVWPFIGKYSLLFLVVCIALLGNLWLNSKNKFELSKWLYVLVVYSMGVLSTFLLGGSSLYHIQSLLIFTSCLILFDHKKEYSQILAGIPFVAICIAVGEYQLFDVPDFSHHWWNETARLANIFSLFAISTLLINFIIRLNTKSENELSLALGELKKSKNSLEEQVEIRTKELSEQRNLLELQN